MMPVIWIELHSIQITGIISSHKRFLLPELASAKPVLASGWTALQAGPGHTGGIEDTSKIFLA